MRPVSRWLLCARALLSLLKRASSTAFQLRHIRFVRRRWRSAFRGSSSIRIGASSIMATLSRRGGFLPGGGFFSLLLGGCFGPPRGGGRGALFWSPPPRGAGAPPTGVCPPPPPRR